MTAIESIRNEYLAASAYAERIRPRCHVLAVGEPIPETPRSAEALNRWARADARVRRLAVRLYRVARSSVR